MTWLFIAAFIFGGGLVAMSLIGHDTDGVDTDTDGAFDDVGLLAIFSLRNLTWASFAFGGIGLIGVLTGRSIATQLISSTVIGLTTLMAVHFLFRFLRQSEAGELPLDGLVFGTPADLVLPFNEAGLGKVSFTASGQFRELPARRADDVQNLEASRFRKCRIEYIADGVAVVKPDSF